MAFDEVYEKMKSALTDLHALGYVHNDAHSKNFIIDGAGDVFLIDFGSAHRLPLDTSSKLAEIMMRSDKIWLNAWKDW